MGKVLGWAVLALVVLLLIGQVGYYSVGISTSDETLEVPSGRYVAQVLRVDDVYNGDVEVRLDARHLSGPPVDLYVLDKEAFTLFENEGKWIGAAGGGGVDLVGRRVLNDRFRPVHADLRMMAFEGRLDTGWIPIGRADTLYLVLSSRDATRAARVDAVLTVRDN